MEAKLVHEHWVANSPYFERNTSRIRGVGQSLVGVGVPGTSRVPRLAATLRIYCPMAWAVAPHAHVREVALPVTVLAAVVLVEYADGLLSAWQLHFKYFFLPDVWPGAFSFIVPFAFRAIAAACSGRARGVCGGVASFSLSAFSCSNLVCELLSELLHLLQLCVELALSLGVLVQALAPAACAA